MISRRGVRNETNLKLLARFPTTLLLLGSALPFAASAQSLDGAWAGSLTCSENLLNRNPPYSVSLSVQIAGVNGRAERIDAQSIEAFSLQVQPSGMIDLQSTGRLRSDSSPRWVTRFTGRASNAEVLEFNGQMFTPDGKLVRERCSVALRRGAQSAANSTSAATNENRLTELLREATQSSATPPTPAGLPSDSPSDRAARMSHRTYQMREVKPRVPPRSTAGTTAGPGGLPLGEGGALYLPEDWLLGSGQPWHYRTTPRGGAVPVPVRSANPEEFRVIEKARALMQQIESRVVAFIADGEIVEVITTGGIRFDTRLMSASMAKTVTALAAGKAICAGRISMDKRADAMMPGLVGTDLGAATLRDLLLMASGTTKPSAGDYLGYTPDEFRHYMEGPGNLEQMLATPSQSTAQRGFFSKVRPGERFSYNARDPFTVAMMLERSVGMPATRWVEQQLLGEFAAEYPAILATDRSGYFHGANGSIRLALIDWIRLAIYVDNQHRTDTCFGRFIRDMGKTQIRPDGTVSNFSGYSYFTWTENFLAPNTFWAVGYGGQRIGWSSDPSNKRIFLMFSNSADRHMDQVYPIARDWFAIGQRR